MAGERERARRPRRNGPGRVRLHIVLLALLGAAALLGGVVGRRMLESRTEGLARQARASALLEETVRQSVEAASGTETDKALLSAVSTGASSRKRALREAIAAQAAQGTPDREIAAAALGTLKEGILDRVADEARRAEIAGRLDAAAPGIALAAGAEAQRQAGEVNAAAVRMQLQVSEPWYPLMYYYAALLFAGVFLLLFALALLLLYLRGDEEKRAGMGRRLEVMDYLLPFMAGVVAFTLYPIVRVVIMSFQERYRLEGSFAGWGPGNYRYVLEGIPGTTNYFLQGLLNTLLYVLYTVPIATALAVVIAYLLNQKLRFSALFQTAYFLPMVTSVTAVGLVWRWIFNRNFGVLNFILSLFGVGQVDFLQKAGNSLTVLVIFGIWSSLPFTIILLLSGLQNIDETYYTVARVDGAKAFRIFRRITVPLLAPTIGLVLIINSISAFKVFTEVKVLFSGYPGPVKNLYTVVYYIYDMMYENRELGRAAAAAILLFLIIFAFTMLQRFIQRRWKYD